MRIAQGAVPPIEVTHMKTLLFLLPTYISAKYCGMGFKQMLNNLASSGASCLRPEKVLKVLKA
ncbi:unnamed protein product [Symbiodinium necroappetens]|uniref:Uncharacterized protein n=1 Tax=Symbiodinium necroappetens TaxID=1628268 RepID=A0A812Y1D9_9DINO|nr:unnamed protein product [Symbiodinium necroappetens]